MHSSAAVDAMKFSVPPQSTEVRRALGEHITSTNQLEYVEKFGNGVPARRGNGGSSNGGFNPNMSVASSMSPQRGTMNHSSNNFNSPMLSKSSSQPRGHKTSQDFYPHILQKYHQNLDPLLSPQEQAAHNREQPTTLRHLARHYDRKRREEQKKARLDSKKNDQDSGALDESTALLSKEERARRETVKILKTDVGMMRSHLYNLKTLARHGARYVNDLGQSEAADLRMLHSHTSRRHIRTSERLYSEPSLAYLEPLELKEHLKMKAERGRYSESRATAYRGYDTTKDVKHLSVKLKNAGVRVVPPGETYLTNALKNTYFTPSPTDPTASGAAASSSSTMQPPQPPSQQPESLKGFHPSLTVHQQPIEVYEYLSREDEATKQRELDMNSMFDLEAVEEEAAEMEQQQNNFVGTRASKKDRRDGERRWFAPSHEAGPNSPRHWRGKKPTKGTVKNPNQHEKPWEFSRYKTDKKKHAVENPAVKREPPGRL